MAFLFCIMGFAAQNYFVGVLFLFFTILSAWYAYSVRNRLRFAGEILDQVRALLFFLTLMHPLKP